MSTITELEGSELFLVRVWSGEDGEGKPEWVGRLQHVVSGAARPFVGCPELMDALLAMLPDTVGDGGVSGDADRSEADST